MDTRKIPKNLLNFEEWVLDVSMGPLVFLPVERLGDGKFRVYTGLAFMVSECPGVCIGLYHPEGKEKIRLWAEKASGMEAEGVEGSPES